MVRGILRVECKQIFNPTFKYLFFLHDVDDLSGKELTRLLFAVKYSQKERKAMLSLLHTLERGQNVHQSNRVYQLGLLVAVHEKSVFTEEGINRHSGLSCLSQKYRSGHQNATIVDAHDSLAGFFIRHEKSKHSLF